MRYLVTHVTRYSGNESVSVGHNEAWLTPREMPRQRRLVQLFLAILVTTPERPLVTSVGRTLVRVTML